MPISRRQFVVSSLACAGSLTSVPLVHANSVPILANTGLVPAGMDQTNDPSQELYFMSPTFSIVPVVGDGKWIWTKPPQDKTGYLEPREFDVSIGIRWTGRGNASDLVASTVFPAEHPEQQLVKPTLVPKGCVAEIKQLTNEVAQLVAAAPSIAKGQVIEAIASTRATISKDYRGFEKDRFPEKQSLTRELKKTYLGDSPGIQSKTRLVKQIVKEVSGDLTHPWEKAKRFYQWVWENIKGKPGFYTSVTTAIKKKVGDCEERAGVFVALCRSAGIPARLVWVPNHAWAEIGLFDAQNQFHWIPIHTAAYSWFGWTGAHELVLQKGDSIRVFGKNRPQRLVMDWLRWKGTKPKVEFIASIKPVAASGKETGPGAREKQSTGEWNLIGDDPLQRYMRGS